VIVRMLRISRSTIRLPREDLLDGRPVNLMVGVQAAGRDDHEAAVGVVRFLEPRPPLAYRRG
jgi:hypothetical protein